LLFHADAVIVPDKPTSLPNNEAPLLLVVPKTLYQSVVVILLPAVT
jgi:hypothetical protein